MWAICLLISFVLSAIFGECAALFASPTAFPRTYFIFSHGHPNRCSLHKCSSFHCTLISIKFREFPVFLRELWLLTAKSTRMVTQSVVRIPNELGHLFYWSQATLMLFDVIIAIVVGWQIVSIVFDLSGFARPCTSSFSSVFSVAPSFSLRKRC